MPPAATQSPGSNAAPSTPRWLLILHQFPVRPSAARVTTWRRLQRIGAVPLRNAAYVLPDSAQSREDFEWLKKEIIGAGGQATIRDAEAMVEAMENAVPSNRQRPIQSGTLDRRAYRRRVWVTRPRPGVDRMSSAWLIRTFIDPDATFRFADKPNRSQVAFDMFDGDFTHAEGLCTFEVLARSFAVAQPAVRRLGEIVHDIDLKERRYNAPEGPTVAALVEGIRQAHQDDAAALQQGIAMFDALSRTLTGPAEVAQAKRRTTGTRSRRSARR